MQNKNIIIHSHIQPKKRNYKNTAGVGVFLLVIAAVWFASWKLFSGVGNIGGAVDLENKKDNAAQTGSFFSEENDYPVIVMIDNSPEAVPFHVGLSSAAVVYEALVEGGATRLMALFSGAPQADKIGPTRSARPYFVETAAGWSAFYLHGGGSPEALELLRGADVTDLNEISGLGIRYFWRDEDIPRPHNLFTSGDLIALGIDDFELRQLPAEKLLWQWSEKIEKNSDAPDANLVYVDYSEGVAFDASYAYDSKKKVYLREQGGMAHYDQGNGEQLFAANLIVQKVPEEGYYPSGYGRIIIDMIGEGDALFFQEGKAIAGAWKKESQNSQTEWLDKDGKPLILKQGQTWVEIVPGDRSVAYE